MTLGYFNADTCGELVSKAVSRTDLSHTVNVESVNHNLRNDEACIHIGCNVSVNPDGATKVVECKFCVHLDFHGQVLVVVAVHLVNQLGVSR